MIEIPTLTLVAVGLLGLAVGSLVTIAVTLITIGLMARWAYKRQMKQSEEARDLTAMFTSAMVQQQQQGVQG